MRITGGIYRGRTVRTGSSLNIRPATDRVRETLFAILPQYIDFDGAYVLDLYAGTGSLGFESISRGAARATFVDASRESVRLMQRTAKELGCMDRCDIRHTSVERFILRTSGPADLIFADPPYKMKDFELLPGRLSRTDIWDGDSIVVIEHDKRTAFPEDETYTCIRRKVFGDTIVSLFSFRNSRQTERNNS
jgi:16S rRNA (guanine966-N2)-methyltransferase